MLKRIALLVCLALIITWVSGFFIFLLWQERVHVQAPNSPTQGILVLTGGTNRIHTGLMLLAAGRGNHLLISGVEQDLSKDQLLKEYNLDEAIEKRLQEHCCLTLGREATSTIENAQEAAQWIAENRLRTVRLITSAYHLPRAIVTMRRYIDPNEVIWALHPVRPSNVSFGDLSYLTLNMNEYMKLTAALIMALAPKGLH